MCILFSKYWGVMYLIGYFNITHQALNNLDKSHKKTRISDEKNFVIK